MKNLKRFKSPSVIISVWKSNLLRKSNMTKVNDISQMISNAEYFSVI